MYFTSGDKSSITENDLIKMFSLTYDLMDNLGLVVHTKEKDFELWKTNFYVNEGLNYILFFNDISTLLGYIEYKINISTQVITIGQLMISPIKQGDGKTILRIINKFIGEIKDKKINTIKASTNKVNLKMQGLLEKIGFTCYSKTERKLEYSISKDKFINMFQNKKRRASLLA